jgi:hypothetical protein
MKRQFSKVFLGLLSVAALGSLTQEAQAVGYLQNLTVSPNGTVTACNYFDIPGYYFFSTGANSGNGCSRRY